MSGSMAGNLIVDPLKASRRAALARFLARFAVATLVCVIGANSLYAGQQKPKKRDNRHEIEQLEEAWRNAMLKSDTAAMGGLLSNDYIAITASGTLQTKEEALASLRTRKLHLTTLNITDRKVRFYGHTALVNSLAEVQGTTPDGDLNGAFRYTRVYVLNPQGQWKIVSFEASLIRDSAQHR